MRIAVAYIDPKTGTALCRGTECKPGATVREAALSAGVPVTDSTEFAIWNERADADRKLSEGDRVDVLSAIKVDPKIARSLRAQSSRSSQKQSIARHGGKHQLHV
jgi:putative ubiquitin-RnfH superfamily antitoxin RatB of RatAB toxin-antitoxin module